MTAHKLAVVSVQHGLSCPKGVLHFCKLKWSALSTLLNSHLLSIVSSQDLTPLLVSAPALAVDFALLWRNKGNNIGYPKTYKPPHSRAHTHTLAHTSTPRCTGGIFPSPQERKIEQTLSQGDAVPRTACRRCRERNCTSCRCHECRG